MVGLESSAELTHKRSISYYQTEVDIIDALLHCPHVDTPYVTSLGDQENVPPDRDLNEKIITIGDFDVPYFQNWAAICLPPAAQGQEYESDLETIM